MNSHRYDSPAQRGLPAANERLLKLYSAIGRKGREYDTVCTQQVAEFCLSRRFFDRHGDSWQPAHISPFMDMGLAVPLRSIQEGIDALSAELRAAVPDTDTLYISPRGHHCTMQHLLNDETIQKKSLQRLPYTELLLTRFIPEIAAMFGGESRALLRAEGATEVTLTFDRLVVSASDGSIILLGTCTPDGLLHAVRKKWWEAFSALQVAGVRDSPWEVLHSTVGRLQPAAGVSPPRMAISRERFAALHSVIDAYNDRPYAQKLQVTFRPADDITFFHNRAMFSVDTYAAHPVSRLVRGSKELEGLLAQLREHKE
eukprot:TRINITY_DN59969_c0_g1_i1.p1 TRINITY_DN59969_c0_g1~~TRINITY_DN59969_c0_g1_i1.p1  ORF type:complete len:364 (+),score=122.33 TRINITY_DN59969_c0_g1_i1:153-1094(+)